MFTMVAGPVPSQGGNIAVYRFVPLLCCVFLVLIVVPSVVEGKTPTGCDFRQYCGGFGSEVEAKFAEFARLVFREYMVSIIMVYANILSSCGRAYQASSSRN